MKCNECEALLPLAIDGGLSREEASQMRDHVATCERCRQSLAMYEALESSLRELALEVPSWKHARATLMRRLGYKRENSVLALLSNLPFMTSLGLAALGIASWLWQGYVLRAMQFTSNGISIAFDRAFTFLLGYVRQIPGIDYAVLLQAYLVMTILIVIASGMSVMRYVRK
jgi:anti-sigma factor RsiW